VPGGGAKPPKPETEAHFQGRVTAYAEAHGWDWMHVPRSMVRGGWRTQIVGSLGKGWPDLFLVRGARLVFLELKTDAGSLSADQRKVHDVLRHIGEVYVLRPRDWAEVERQLT
jgi:hypothetical protein